MLRNKAEGGGPCLPCRFRVLIDGAVVVVVTVTVIVAAAAAATAASAAAAVVVVVEVVCWSSSCAVLVAAAVAPPLLFLLLPLLLRSPSSEPAIQISNKTSQASARCSAGRAALSSLSFSGAPDSS